MSNGHENQMGCEDYDQQVAKADAREDKEREQELQRRRLQDEKRRKEEEAQHAKTMKAVQMYERDEKASQLKEELRRLELEEEKQTEMLLEQRAREKRLLNSLRDCETALGIHQRRMELETVIMKIRNHEDEIRSIRKSIKRTREEQISEVDFSSDPEWAEACVEDMRDGHAKDLLPSKRRRRYQVFIPKISDPSHAALPFDVDWDNSSMDWKSSPCQAKVGGGGAARGGGASEKAAGDAAPDDDSQRTVDERAQAEPDDAAPDDDSQRTTDEEGGLQPEPVAVSAFLTYAGEPEFQRDFPDIQLSKEGTTLGRLPDKNVIVLEHKKQLGMVSAKHLQVKYDAGKDQWTINEHGTPSNGTLVQTENMKFPIRVSEWTLNDGDVVTLGGASSAAMRGSPLSKATRSIYMFKFRK